LVLLLPSGASARNQYYCRMRGASWSYFLAIRQSASQAASPVLSKSKQRLLPNGFRPRLGGAFRRTREAVQGVGAAAVLTPLLKPSASTFGAMAAVFCAESTQAPLADRAPLFYSCTALFD